jgi:hypothetical protein
MREFFESHADALAWAQEREDEGYECVMFREITPGESWADTQAGVWYVDTYLVPDDEEELAHV